MLDTVKITFFLNKTSSLRIDLYMLQNTEAVQFNTERIMRWTDYLSIILGMVRRSWLSRDDFVPKQKAQPGHQSISRLIHWGGWSQLLVFTWKKEIGVDKFGVTRI